MVPRQQVAGGHKRDHHEDQREHHRQRHPVPGELSSDTVHQRGQQSATDGVSELTHPQRGVARTFHGQERATETSNDNARNDKEAPRRRNFPDFSYGERQSSDNPPSGSDDHRFPAAAAAAAAHVVTNRRSSTEGSAAIGYRSLLPSQPAADGGRQGGGATTNTLLRDSRSATRLEAAPASDTVPAAPGSAQNKPSTRRGALPARRRSSGDGGGGPQRQYSETVEHRGNLLPSTKGVRYDRIQPPPGSGSRNVQPLREVKGRPSHRHLIRGPEARTRMTPREAEERGHDPVAVRDYLPLARVESLDVGDSHRHRIHRHHDRGTREPGHNSQGREAVELKIVPPGAAAANASSGRGKEGQRVASRSGMRGGRGAPPPPPPLNPPEFVMHVEAVLRWLGVEGLTPEVLRRAKRGLREQHVAEKMWRALLRVALLHLDATKNATPLGAPEPDPEPQPEHAPKTHEVNSVPCGKQKAKSGLVLRSVPRPGPVRHSEGGFTYEGSPDGNSAGGMALGVKGRRGSSSEARGVGVGEGGTGAVPLPLAMETCGYLLPLWGYRRTAFVAGIRVGDALRTREVLLALSWMMSKARVFHAHEQACLVSPISDLPPRQQPLPFPEDPSQTPENVRFAREAFSASLRDEGRPPDWGGVAGMEEAVRMGEAGSKGERLARALGAAREMMCCYGRLEGELRVVEGLETAREKMLLRMRHLHEDIAASHPEHRTTSHGTSPSRGSTPTARNQQQQQQQQQQKQQHQHHHHHQQQQQKRRQRSPPVAAAAAAASQAAAVPPPTTTLTTAVPTTAMSGTRSRRRGLGKNNLPTMSPFCLCLLANKSAEELSRSLATVSRACEALEGLEEGWAHAGRWCRWVSTALADASADSQLSAGVAGDEGGHEGGSAQGHPGGLNPSVAAHSKGLGPPLATNGAVLDGTTAGVRGVALQLARSRALQEELERRVMAVPAPGKPPAGSVPATLEVEAEPRLPKRDGFTESPDAFEPGGVFRRAAEEIDLRVGGKALIRALEEPRRQGRRWRQLQRRQGPGQVKQQPTVHLVTAAISPSPPIAEESGRPGGQEDVQPSLLSNNSVSPDPTYGAEPREKNRSLCAGERDELERSRRAHRERLEGLLSACAGAMPFEPRGRSW